MRRGAAALLASGLACLGLACSSVSVEQEALLPTEPDSAVVTFAELDGCCDLVVGGPARGQVDVHRRTGTRWRAVGSFFAARESLQQVVPASVGGRPTLFVRGDREEVTLLGADLIDPHRLRDPVRVFDGGPIHAITSGDFDRDGIDELAVAVGDRLELVDRTEWALFEDPSETPSVDTHQVGGGFETALLAAADATGDGALELYAFREGRPEVRIYDSPGLDREGRREPREVDLPAPAIDATATACADGPVLAVLSDGAVVRVGMEGASDPLPLPGPARAVRAAADAVAIVYSDGTSVTLHDRCGRDGEGLGIASSSVRDLALTASSGGVRRIAVLEDDSDGEVRVFRVEDAF